MWNPRFIPLLYEDLGLRPGITVVDVGCGTGFFTRLIARGMKRKGHVLGIDVDWRLLEHAEEFSAKEHLNIIEYRKGDAYEIPLPDNYADLTVSHMVLHWLSNPLQAMTEMRRITKVGGTVAAVGIDGDIYYDPNNPRLNELDARFDGAFVRGASALEGCDLTLARKFPALLKQAGLQEIRASGYASLDLIGDATFSKEQRRSRLRESLKVAKDRERRKNDLRYALAGGMTKEEANERLDLRVQRLSQWIKEPRAASNDMSLSGNMIIVATGKR
jgi:SAM-dependent methyltransferase